MQAKRLYFIIFLLLCLLGAKGQLAAQPPTPQNGVMDLSAWDFSRAPILPLHGYWGFYWQQYVAPTDTSAAPAQMYVPLYWSHQHEYEEQGFATYRLKIKLPSRKSGLGIKILDISNAYRLYVNGALLSEVGKAGANMENAVPHILPQIVPFPSDSVYDIVIHVANFHHKKGGIWDAVWFGEVQALEQKRNNTLMYSVFLLGAISIIALYYLGHYILLPEEHSSLFFSMLCFLVLSRILATDEMFVLHLLPNLSWEARLRMELIPFYLMPTVGAWFIRSLYPIDFKKQVAWISLFFGGLGTLCCFALPARMHSQLVFSYKFIMLLALLYFIYVASIAIVRRREGAIAFGFGFFFIFGTAFNDLLHSENLISTFFMVPIGIFAFFFCQAIVLAAKSAKSYRRAQVLTQELALLNSSLEKGVYERTIQVEQKHQQMELLNQHLIISEAEARLTASELNETLKKLQSTQAQLVESEKMATLGQLTAGIAHEINNPLNFITGGVGVFAEMVQDLKEIFRLYEKLENATTPEEAEAVKRSLALIKKQVMYEVIFKDMDEVLRDLHAGIHRTNDIVRGLRTFSRGADAIPHPTDIHLCLDSSLTILKTQYKGRIDIVKHYDNSIPPVACMAGPMNQVFINLIGNAIHAISEHGTITISTTKRAGDKVAIAISDTGNGIPADLRKKILEPFFTTKPAGLGTGLGLSISLDIIKKHQGELEIQSEEGKGSTFTVVLPIVQ